MKRAALKRGGGRPLRALVVTDRLELCSPTVGMAPGIVEYVIRNKAHFRSSEPTRAAEYFTEAFWRRRLAAGRRDPLLGRKLGLILLERKHQSQAVVGEIWFTNIVRGPFQACFLGYRLDERHVGKGLMAEALTAAIPYVFSTLRLHRISANYTPENVRSGRLLRRLGFTVEGYARDYLCLDGQWRDHILAALVRSGEA